MTENELYELNRLPEIDPNYEPKRVGASQNENARITTKKAWIISLLFPVLSMIGSAVFIVMFLTDSYFSVFITAFGAVCGGVIPMVMIIRCKLDLSKYFLGKIILFSVLALGVTLSWTVFIIWLGRNFNIFILPMLIIAAEIIFAVLQKADLKTKICLVLSSLTWGYLGFISEMIFSLWYYNHK